MFRFFENLVFGFVFELPDSVVNQRFRFAAFGYLAHYGSLDTAKVEKSSLQPVLSVWLFRDMECF
ncbi:hypothetical protein BUQ74_19870 [Leptospira weilii serovar Heyan]|nr:hypothetical protein BUQ74_19870 [Leptospira weilii serovar Heyan]